MRKKLKIALAESLPLWWKVFLLVFFYYSPLSSQVFISGEAEIIYEKRDPGFDLSQNLADQKNIGAFPTQIAGIPKSLKKKSAACSIVLRKELHNNQKINGCQQRVILPKNSSNDVFLCTVKDESSSTGGNSNYKGLFSDNQSTNFNLFLYLSRNYSSYKGDAGIHYGADAIFIRPPPLFSFAVPA